MLGIGQRSTARALGVCGEHRLYLGEHFVGYGLFELIKAFVDYGQRMHLVHRR
jgi:hypothetical protein